MSYSNGRAARRDRTSERHRGAVTLRREAIPSSTADQKLLDSHNREEWKTKDAWRALRILSEFVEGFDTLAAERGLDVVTFRDWKKIEEAEERAAREGAPREKFVNIEAMIRAGR